MASPISEAEFDVAFAVVDQNGSGYINKDEMKAFIKLLRGIN